MFCRFRQSLFVVRHVFLPEGVGAEAGDASKVCVPVRGRSLSTHVNRLTERTHFASPAKRTYSVMPAEMGVAWGQRTRIWNTTR